MNYFISKKGNVYQYYADGMWYNIKLFHEITRELFEHKIPKTSLAFRVQTKQITLIDEKYAKLLSL
jgi:hypothetical protein